MSFNIFVINLKTSNKRRENIKNALTEVGIEYEIFEAIDGKKNHFLFDNNNMEVKMSSTEYATALSHLKIYDIIVKQNLDFALILEDDVDIDNELKCIINGFDEDKKILNHFDIILAGYHLDNKYFRKLGHISFWNRKKLSKNLFIGKPAFWYWGAYGYFITFRGAKEILKVYQEPKMPSDFLTMNSQKIGLKLGLISRPLIWPNELNNLSNIEERASISDNNSHSETKTTFHSNYIISKIKFIFNRIGLLSLYTHISKYKPNKTLNSLNLLFFKIKN